jgi:arabinan endo-1,5-alpha-L-arabinosidase
VYTCFFVNKLFSKVKGMHIFFKQFSNHDFHKETAAFILCSLLAIPVFSETNPSGITYPPRPQDTFLMQSAAINDTGKWGYLNGHDPSIYKDGDTYWIFSSDVAVGRASTQGLQVRKSKDLVNWTYVGTALDGIPKAAKDYSDASALWAPDVIKLGKKYYLYYAASKMGSQTSCICYAVADKISGPWTDKGIIYKSDYTSDENAIDPCVFFDNDKKLWMVYGSFFDGIHLMKMDEATGLSAGKGPGKIIATRGDSAGEEGPYIIYNPQFKKYYLFVSYDSLSSDYNIRVGRADSVEGPYYDISGQKMTDYPYSDDVPDDVEIIAANVGYKLMGGFAFKNGEGWAAPGHNSVLNDNGEWYVVHHARIERDHNWAFLNVRKLLWSDDGWPMASPERYAGEKEQKIPEESVNGKWELVKHERCAIMDAVSKEAGFMPDKTVTGEYTGSWEMDGDDGMKLLLADEDGNKAEIKGKLLPSWDWENGRACIVFTGIDTDGQAWWAKRTRKLSTKK